MPDDRAGVCVDLRGRSCLGLEACTGGSLLQLCLDDLQAVRQAFDVFASRDPLASSFIFHHTVYTSTG